MALACGSFTAAVIKVNQKAFKEGFDKWMLKQSEQVTLAYRGLVSEVYTYMVQDTPQYTGQTVSNWVMSLTGETKSDTSIRAAYLAAKTHQPFGKVKHRASPGGGSPRSGKDGGVPNLQAVAEAMSSKDTTLKLVQMMPGYELPVVHMTNATSLVGPYVNSVAAIAMNTPPSWLRAVNEPGNVWTNAISWVSSEYQILDANSLKRAVAAGKK